VSTASTNYSSVSSATRSSAIDSSAKLTSRSPNIRSRTKNVPRCSPAKSSELNALGVHGYLLNTLARYSVFGITREQYMERVRQPTRI
jgi:hypothetical protein